MDILCMALITGWYLGIQKNFDINCEFCICIQMKVLTCMLTGNESSLGFIGDVCHHFNAFSLNALNNSGDDTQILEKSLSTSVLRFQPIQDFAWWAREKHEAL